MPAIIDPIDGLPADEVGSWVTKKHEYLERYIRITSAARRKFIGPGNAGATFIDLFSGGGRARIRKTDKWVNGSPLLAWKASLETHSPFSEVFIADTDNALRQACLVRLQSADAPVREVAGNAVQASAFLRKTLNPKALHLAFIDPWSLGSLDFRIIRNLASLERIDLIVHVSAMDLQRNLPANLESDEPDFDRFAPGWRPVVKHLTDPFEIRAHVVEHWRKSVAALGVWPSPEMKLITGDKGQRLYWLVIAAKHKLAQDFWKIASNPDGQGSLF